MSTDNKNGRDLTSILAAAFAAVIVVTLVLYGVIAFVNFGLPVLREKAGTEKTEVKDTEPASSEEQPVVDADDTSAEPEETETTEEKVAIRPTDAVPETAARDDSVEIAAASRETIDRIAAEKSGSSMIFSTDGERDAVNRPVNVNDFMTTMQAHGVNAVCYASDMDTKKVAFTFRANLEDHSGEILDILNNYGIKSTFYISHYYATHNADTVRRMIAENHEIGNQSYTCPDSGITVLSLEDQAADAINMQNYVQQAFSYKMTKYNFCADAWSEASAVLMSEMGYEIAFHSAAFNDADPSAEIDAEAALTMLKEALHPGAVYCFHMTNPVTAQILPGLIEYCKAEGYTFTQLD